MSTSILATGNNLVQPVAHSVSEFVQATGSGGPTLSFTAFIAIFGCLMLAACAVCAKFEHMRYGELVYSRWLSFFMVMVLGCTVALPVAAGFEYL